LPKKEKIKLPKTFTAKELLEEEQKIQRLKTNTPIDDLIGGGIREDEVIEVYGEFGVGKTQLCLTVASQVASQPNGLVYLIDCEDTFRPERLREIAQARGYDPDEVLANIYVAKPETTDEQLGALEALPEDAKPKLIIVDGATTLYRAEYLGREQLAAKQQALRKFLHRLKKYSLKNKIPTIITNQVYANPDGSPYLDLTLRELAVGGHTLYHIINNRIFIRKAKEGKRIARLVDSSEYPQAEVTFVITSKGVETPKKEEQLKNKGEGLHKLCPKCGGAGWVQKSPNEKMTCDICHGIGVIETEK
jgi:DNA repair protein RadA